MTGVIIFDFEHGEVTVLQPDDPATAEALRGEDNVITTSVGVPPENIAD